MPHFHNNEANSGEPLEAGLAGGDGKKQLVIVVVVVVVVVVVESGLKMIPRMPSYT